MATKTSRPNETHTVTERIGIYLAKVDHAGSSPAHRATPSPVDPVAALRTLLKRVRFPQRALKRSRRCGRIRYCFGSSETQTTSVAQVGRAPGFYPERCRIVADRRDQEFSVFADYKKEFADVDLRSMSRLAAWRC